MRGNLSEETVRKLPSTTWRYRITYFQEPNPGGEGTAGLWRWGNRDWRKGFRFLTTGFRGREHRYTIGA